MITIDLTKENKSVNINFSGNVIYTQTGGGGGGGSSEATITEDIIIAGGALSNDVLEDAEWDNTWKDNEGNRIIPKGTSFNEAFSKLFSKVINGTVEWSEVTWNPQMKQPTLTLSKTGTVEVGTEVTVTASAVSELVANMTPALRNSKKPGLYDDINNRFLTNIGTDEFTYQ